MDKEKDEIIINETEPVVEPARPEPATEPKPKKRVCLGILLSVLGILLVGGALALGYLWGNNTIKPADSNNSITSNENTTQSENGGSKISADTKIVNEETEVKELISQMYDILEKKVERPGFLVKTYNNNSVYYQPEDMATPTSLDETYGIYYNYGNLENTQDLSESIKNIFNDLGFDLYKIIVGISELPEYINNNKQIICATTWTASADAYISCGKTNWISDNKKALINNLVKAMGQESYHGIIMADESNIVNSSIAPYQILNAAVSNAAGLFYRNSPDSEWKYFTSAQMMVPCEKYSEHPDAENIKKAFADQECLKDSSGAMLKVSEL